MRQRLSQSFVMTLRHRTQISLVRASDTYETQILDGLSLGKLRSKVLTQSLSNDGRQGNTFIERPLPRQLVGSLVQLYLRTLHLHASFCVLMTSYHHDCSFNCRPRLPVCGAARPSDRVQPIWLERSYATWQQSTRSRLSVLVEWGA